MGWDGPSLPSHQLPLPWVSHPHLNLRVTPMPSSPPPQVLSHLATRRHVRCPAESPALKHFLGILVPTLSRATLNLSDMHAAVDRLFPKWVGRAGMGGWVGWVGWGGVGWGGVGWGGGQSSPPVGLASTPCSCWDLCP
jgi:hypothetical protein